METEAECHTGTKAQGKKRAQEAGETELCRRRLSSVGPSRYVLYKPGKIRYWVVHSKLADTSDDFVFNRQVFLPHV